MAKQVLTLSQTVERAVTCERCQARYVYDHKVEVKETLGSGSHAEAVARARAEAALTRDIAETTKIVPCPRCKALTGKMRSDHLMIAFVLIGLIVVSLIGGGIILAIAAAGGVFFWYLALLAAGGAALGVLGLLLWPLGVYKEKIGRLV